jgi:hypothetical protein
MKFTKFDTLKKNIEELGGLPLHLKIQYGGQNKLVVWKVRKVSDELVSIDYILIDAYTCLQYRKELEIDYIKDLEKIPTEFRNKLQEFIDSKLEEYKSEVVAFEEVSSVLKS